MSSTNALRSVATGDQKNPVTAFRGFLEKQKTQLAAALPKHVSPDRMIRLATTEFAKNQLLQKCTPVSIFGAIIQSSQLGLEIGVLGQAYLVPYKNNKTNSYEAQFIPGYKGLIALARRSGEVTSIETHIVYENDEFELNLGIDSQVKHVPYLDGERGASRLVYGVAKFKDGGYHFEWMSIADVNKIRARSKARDNGPWVTDYEQMVRKTLIRRMSNYLPMSIELQNAIQISDAADEGKRASLDGDFVIVDEGEEEHSAGSTSEEAGPDEFVEIRKAIAACVTEIELIKLMNELSPKTKKALNEDLRAKQVQLKSESSSEGVTYAAVAEKLNSATDADLLDAAADLIKEVQNEAQREELASLYQSLRANFVE